MTVAQLIVLLQQHDGNLPVYINRVSAPNTVLLAHPLTNVDVHELAWSDYYMKHRIVDYGDDETQTGVVLA